MYRYRNFQSYPNEERFLGPLFPFIGGALVGYAVSRPNFTGPIYQPYYPVYYHYQPAPYYPQYNYQNMQNTPQR